MGSLGTPQTCLETGTICFNIWWWDRSNWGANGLHWLLPFVLCPMVSFALSLSVLQISALSYIHFIHLDLPFFFFFWLFVVPDAKFNEIYGVPSPMLVSLSSIPKSWAAPLAFPS